MFILFRFVRDESGLIRGNNVSGATVDIPVVLTRFGHYFSKIIFIHCTVRSQFCRRRYLWFRIIRKWGFERVWIFVYNFMTCASMPFIVVMARVLFLSLLLPVMTVRFRIRDRFLLFFLFFRARILPELIVAWLGFMFHSEVFGYHLKGPNRRLHGMWFVGK
jgi:hypothetical protein